MGEWFHKVRNSMTYPSGDSSVHEVILIYWVLDQDIIRLDVAPKLCEWERSELSSAKGSDWEIPQNCENRGPRYKGTDEYNLGI